MQELVPLTRDADEAGTAPADGKLLYVKLHGCISNYQLVAPPLIASTEQIINHKLGRAGQFAEFLEWARARTLIFAGYGLGDANLRTLFDEIVKEGDNRPRHYIIGPGMQPVEIRYWADRRVQALSIAFQELLERLDFAIRPEQRKLALHASALPNSSFSRFISVADRIESRYLLDFLLHHCEHVSQDTSSGGGDPKKFYQGFDLGWYPTERSLDVTRSINATILKEQVVPTTATARPLLVVLKAHAGAGKSVTIRRIAWDTAKIYDRLVFYVNKPSGLSLKAFEEIISLTNQTIYIFLDDLADLVTETEELLKEARKKKWRLVIIAGARVNEWNIKCEVLHSAA